MYAPFGETARPARGRPTSVWRSPPPHRPAAAARRGRAPRTVRNRTRAWRVRRPPTCRHSPAPRINTRRDACPAGGSTGAGIAGPALPPVFAEEVQCQHCPRRRRAAVATHPSGRNPCESFPAYDLAGIVRACKQQTALFASAYQNIACPATRRLRKLRRSVWFSPTAILWLTPGGCSSRRTQHTFSLSFGSHLDQAGHPGVGRRSAAC